MLEWVPWNRGKGRVPFQVAGHYSAHHMCPSGKLWAEERWIIQLLHRLGMWTSHVVMDVGQSRCQELPSWTRWWCTISLRRPPAGHPWGATLAATWRNLVLGWGEKSRQDSHSSPVLWMECPARTPLFMCAFESHLFQDAFCDHPNWDIMATILYPGNPFYLVIICQ